MSIYLKMRENNLHSLSIVGRRLLASFLKFSEFAVTEFIGVHCVDSHKLFTLQLEHNFVKVTK